MLYTANLRFLDPVGEKIVIPMSPGGADFVYPFNGARALLAGINPYIHDEPALFDPWKRDNVVGGVLFRQFYPPSHLLLYVPLAWVTGGDFREASRIWFHLNLLWLLALSLVLRGVLRDLLGQGDESGEVVTGLWLFLLFALSTNQGVALALERGQSDIFCAVLCWGALLAWVRGQRFLPMFLAVWVTLLKGYGALFAAGLGVLGLGEPRGRRSVIGGAALAAFVMLAPVAEYLPEAAAATTYRANMFWPIWFNHSYKSLAYNIAPGLADAGRVALGGLALFGTCASWWVLWRTSRAGAERPVLTLWLMLFACASLSTMLGISALSCSYNLVHVLPGALLLAIAQRRLLEHAPVGSEAFVGVIMCLLCLALFVFYVGSPGLPPAAFGLIGLPLLAAAAALRSSLLMRAGAAWRPPVAVPARHAG